MEEKRGAQRPDGERRGEWTAGERYRQVRDKEEEAEAGEQYTQRGAHTR